MTYGLSGVRNFRLNYQPCSTDFFILISVEIILRNFPVKFHSFRTISFYQKCRLFSPHVTLHFRSQLKILNANKMRGTYPLLSSL